MNINFTFDPTTVNATTLGSAANLNAFENQINAAGRLFTSTFLDPVAVNITVKYGATSLGQSNQLLYRYALSTVKDALQKDITSLDDLTFANSFTGGSGAVYLTHAQLKALGLIAPTTAGSDGTITFSNTPGIFDYNHSASMAASKYDLYGVAAHEISEIMGRMVNPTLGSGTTAPTILTQSNIGGRFTLGSEATLPFNTVAGGDLGDWASSVAANDAFRAFSSPGVVSSVSSTDLRTVDVAGWDRRALDLVFAIDTTGSMGPYIDNVKVNATAIANAAFGTAANPVDARIGIVGFKDATGPNGPGQNTAVLKFTDQPTYDARKAATVAAINGLTVGGGGDIPEGDNSALLYALQGNLGDWRRAAQDHKIVLFTDAPIKDTGLAAQVAAAAAKLGATVTSSSVTSFSGGAVGSFAFEAPVSAASAINPNPGASEPDVDGVLDGPAPEKITFTSQVYAIQVGNDTSATAGLKSLAASTGGQYLTASSGNLSDMIIGIINPLRTVDVFRFFDTQHGTHFFTNSVSERDQIIAQRADLLSEGTGLAAVDPGSTDPNAAPVFRFFDSVYGTHFFTASVAEKDGLVASRSDLVFEGTGFYEHTVQQTNDIAVYRFFDTQFGTHFYTADAAERASILSTRPDLKDEGIGFYTPKPT